MAEVEEALVDRLEASTGLTALTSQRFYHLRLPQKPTYPCLVYHLVSRERFPLMSADAGVVRSRIQFDIYDQGSSGTAKVKSVAKQVRKSLQRWRSSTAVLEVQDVYIDRESELYEDEPKAYRVEQDYLVWHKEST